MLREKLVTLIARFFDNNTMAFSAFNLFQIVTEGVLVAEADFAPWFDLQSQRLELVKGKHYYIFPGPDKELSTKITGHAALAILVHQDNEIGAYARRIMIDDGWEIRWLIKVLTKKEP